jgi:hypothetical protein
MRRPPRHVGPRPSRSPGTKVRDRRRILIVVTRAATVPAPQDVRPPPVATPGPLGVQWAAGTRARKPAWPYLCAFALYLAASLATWWHLVAHGFGAALPAGSADPGQEVWFLAWLPHALGSGLNPFFSHAVFAPSGVNLLDNTSFPLLGLLLAPVTVTAGPVASLDVAVLLAPVSSALGAFALCRRYVSWSPAAFAGGLCYGFGPFLTGDLRYGHLDLTWLVLPPLIFCCLDALLLRDPFRQLLVGAALGLLVVAQFFVSTEMLAITALTAFAAVVVVTVGWPRAATRQLVAAWRGLAVATVIVAAALAYPFWVVIDGPRHVVGPIWHHIGAIATSLASTVEPHGELAGVAFISGSNGSYLGFALVAVLVVGAVVWWRSTVLRITLVVGLIAYVASLGYRLHVGHRALNVALPAAVLGHVPLLDSIVPERFSAMVDLFCGVALALVLDHVRRWGTSRPSLPAGVPARHPSGPRRETPLLVALSLAVGVFALVPLGALPRWPYPVTGVRRPAVFASPASPLSRTASANAATTPTVAVYPDSSPSVSNEMVWQAQDGFSFALSDGYAIVPGPGLRAVEAPPTDALWLVFAAGSVGRLDLPLTRSTRAALRGDLSSLGVDVVVVLPGAKGSRSVRRALGEVLGPPAVFHGAAIWRVRPAAG